MTDNFKFKTPFEFTEGWELRVAEAFTGILRKHFDRAFAVTVDKVNGKIRVMVNEQDTGGPIMTVGDLANFLQMDRSQIRQMCKARAQRSPHALPFVKINGKNLRFRREAILRWLETIPKPMRLVKRRR